MKKKYNFQTLNKISIKDELKGLDNLPDSLEPSAFITAFLAAYSTFSHTTKK